MNIIRRVARAGLPVIARGGISRSRTSWAVREAGAQGAVVGRAVLEGSLDLASALAWAAGPERAPTLARLMGFLSQLTRDLRARLAVEPLDEGALLALLEGALPVRDLLGALAAGPPAIVAEIKRASPSAGAIATTWTRPGQGLRRRGGGGRLGTDRDLAFRRLARRPRCRHAARGRSRPAQGLLGDPAQVLEARAHGADSVLLMTACLSDAELVGMLAAARELGMEPLVETHSDRDSSGPSRRTRGWSA